MKLYFMCGLPDRDRRGRAADRRPGRRRSSQAGREASGSKRHPLHRLDRRLRAQAAHAVPVGGPARPRDHRRPAAQAARRDPRRPQYGQAIGFRYHDGKPGIVEGLLSRGDRRVGAVIEQVWRDGGRFDGWSEHFSYDRWMTARRRGARRPAPSTSTGSPPASATEHEVLPWDHLDSGLDKDWLWEDWQDALAEVEVEDCRWTPCFDCGVCPTMGTEIQIGPTGAQPAAAHRRRIAPAADGAAQPDGPPPPPTVQRLRIRYAKRGRLRFTSHRDFQRALERALRRAEVPMAYSAGLQPAPQDLLRRRRADRRGQRGRVPRDRA